MDGPQEVGNNRRLQIRRRGIQTITKQENMSGKGGSSPPAVAAAAVVAEINLCASCDRCRARKTRCDGQRPCSACTNNYILKTRGRGRGKFDETSHTLELSNVDLGCFYSPAKRRGPSAAAALYYKTLGTAAATAGAGGGGGSLSSSVMPSSVMLGNEERGGGGGCGPSPLAKGDGADNDDDEEDYAAPAIAGLAQLGSATAEGDAGSGAAAGGNKQEQASMSSEPMPMAATAAEVSAAGSLERAIAMRMGVTQVAKPKTNYSQENIQSTNSKSIKDRLRADYILCGTVPKKSADQHAQRSEITNDPPKEKEPKKKKERKKKSVRIYKKCNIPGCTNNARNGSRCTRHGAGVQLCIVSGCTNRAQSVKLGGGRCARHGAPYKKCSEEGCDRKAKLQGKCCKHGGVKTCTYEGCSRNVVRYGYCKQHCKEVHGDVSQQRPDGTTLTLREFGKKRKRDAIEQIELPPEEPVMCLPVVGATATQAAAAAAAIPQQEQNNVDFGPYSRDVAWGNEDEEDYEDAAIQNAIDSHDKIILLEQRYDKALARQRDTIAGLRAQLTSLAAEVHTSKSEVNTLKAKIVTDKDKYVGLGSEYRRVVDKLENITGEREESAFRKKLCSDGEHEGIGDEDEEEQGDDENENFSDDEHKQGLSVHSDQEESDDLRYSEGKDLSGDMKQGSKITPYKSLDARWMERYTELEQYNSSKGHCNYPTTGKCTEYPKLTNWVQQQRRQYREGKLSDDRFEHLEEIGFEWDLGQKSVPWEQRYVELQQYKSSEGHCNIPSNSTEHPTLANWVKRQRRQYKEGKLSDVRFQHLENIGFEWDLGQKGVPRKQQYGEGSLV